MLSSHSFKLGRDVVPLLKETHYVTDHKSKD